MASGRSGSERDLGGLLSEPRESLDIELKEWLDLGDHDQRANIAKEIIALANHGGGYLLIGFAESDDGSFKPAGNAPSKLDAWSQDAVQSIIAKYIRPSIQCRVIHHTGPVHRAVVIEVPGGHRHFIRAKAGSPGNKIVPHRVYVRRPGPASEEPQTEDEWDLLFERVLQNRKDELLAAMRSIMEGVAPTTSTTRPRSKLDDLIDFETAADKRWNQRLAQVQEGLSPWLPHGHYDVSIAIDGTFDEQPLSALRQTIASAVRNHSGWPPFLTLERPPFTPSNVDGAVEFWRGPDTDGSVDQPNHHDFWRISPKGLLFTRRGLNEDDTERYPASGQEFHLTSATWRIGEAVMEAAYIAKALKADDADLICRCKWVGLAGRRLSVRGSNRILFNVPRVSHQDIHEAMTVVAVSALPSSLPEVVFNLLQDLYALFGFFQLPNQLVKEELSEMLRHTFAL